LRKVILIVLAIAVIVAVIVGTIGYEVISMRHPVAVRCGQPEKGKTVYVCMTTTDFFSPSSIVVVIGVNNTVQWTNDGDVYHTSTVYPPGQAESWNSGSLAPGGIYMFTFVISGNYTYYCSIHPFMRGTVIVKTD
jgi:plastocyanin